MKNLLRIALAIALTATLSPAMAKNKENCHGIGGKWLPGSTTDPEKGACIFAIRADKSSLVTQQNRVVNATGDNSVTSEGCTQKSGKVSKDGKQCVVEMTQGRVAGNPGPTEDKANKPECPPYCPTDPKNPNGSISPGFKSGSLIQTK